MVILVKDANQQVQNLATAADGSSNLVPVHLAASLQGGVATPASAAAPLPVIPLAAAAAIDGSGTLAATGVAQTLFGGVVPVNGYLVNNNSGSGNFFVSDVGAATTGGASIEIGSASTFITPPGYHTPGPVSIVGTLGQTFAARRW